MQAKKSHIVFRVLKWTGISILSIFLVLSAGVFLMKDKIIQKVVAEMNTQLQTPIAVDNIDLTFWASFPSMSLDFNKVSIAENAPQGTKPETLFYSDRVRLKFNPFDILEGKYKVKAISVFPGHALVRTFADGTNNFDMVKVDTSSAESAFELSLQKIHFSDFRLTYENHIQDQYHTATLKSSDLKGDFSKNIFDLAISSDLVLNSVKSGALNLITDKTASWDIKLHVDKIKNQVLIKNAPITIADLPFLLNIDTQNDRVDVRVLGNNIELADFAQKIQHSETERIKDLKGQGIVRFDLRFLQDSIPNSENELTCFFGIQNGKIVEPKDNLTISAINVSGKFTNKDDLYGSLVDLQKLSFVTAGSQFNAEAKLFNFDNLQVTGKANGKLNLEVIAKIFPVKELDHIKGTVDLATIFDVQNRGSQWKVNRCDGTADFYETQFKLKDDKRFFDHISGRLALNGNNIAMKNLNMIVGKSDMKLNGDIAFLGGLFNLKEEILTELDIKSAYMNIQDFSSNTKAEEIKDGRNFILPANVKGEVHMLANNMVYENHSFKQLRTDLEVNNRQLTFHNLHLNNAQADMDGEVDIAEFSPEVFTISTKLKSTNIQFSPLFKEWNNFDQEVLTADNISGLAQVDMVFKAPFDLKTGINMKAVKSNIKIRVENGRLKNVSSFKDITASLNESVTTRLLLKRHNITNFEKELSDLSFATIENELIITDGSIFIPSMLIASNAMNVNLEGRHDFDNQIDYKINFNFRDIRKIKSQSEFGEVIDDGSGLQLYVRMFGPMDDPTIKWDSEAKRAVAKATFQEEKQTAKSILKTEFGFFKKDSTVQAYQPKKIIKERVQMVFEEEKKIMATKEQAEPKKLGKLGNTLNKWKKAAEAEKEAEFSVGGF